MPLLPGYRALGVLHRNGAIAVYDAWSEERACRCIVKTVLVGLASARDKRALVREGRLVLSLSHPHIVRAYELLLRPRPTLVLETLPGETLSYTVHARGRLHARDVAQLGIQLCSAIAYLHRRGMLHLDLKPSNVVSHGGLARVIDLGLARPPGRGHRGVGSAPYLAPEQAAGGRLSPATDVFGLGGILYRMATGRAPFSGTPGRAGFEQLHRRARVRDERVAVPRRLADLIDSCLDPCPADRLRLEDLSVGLRACT